MACSTPAGQSRAAGDAPGNAHAIAAQAAVGAFAAARGGIEPILPLGVAAAPQHAQSRSVDFLSTIGRNVGVRAVEAGGPLPDIARQVKQPKQVGLPLSHRLQLRPRGGFRRSAASKRSSNMPVTAVARKGRE